MLVLVLVQNNDSIYLQASFLARITDVVRTSFKLGELHFTASTNITTLSLFSCTVFLAVDINFNDVEAQLMSEPATYSLIPLIVGFMFFSTKRKQGEAGGK